MKAFGAIVGRTVRTRCFVHHNVPAQARSAFTLPTLPWAKEALAPHMSPETIDYHYGKHHQTYVTNLNNFVTADKSLEGKTLEQLVKSTSGGIFNNAAQVWNHTFFWHSLSPASTSKSPSPDLAAAINKKWGSIDNFKAEFNKAAGGQFGSGWAWLVSNKAGELKIVTTSNAATPITEADTIPLLTCDVWEHAYYIDYRNSRPNYLAGFWALANWEFASSNYATRK